MLLFISRLYFSASDQKLFLVWMCFIYNINASGKVIFLPCLSTVIVDSGFTVCACFVIKVLVFLLSECLVTGCLKYTFDFRHNCINIIFS